MYRAESLVSFICKHDLIKIGPKQKGNVLHVVQPTSIIFNSGETSLTVSLVPRLSPCGLGMRLSHSRKNWSSLPPHTPRLTGLGNISPPFLPHGLKFMTQEMEFVSPTLHLELVLAGRSTYRAV